MKALTICNPYPEMILQGTKRVESRLVDAWDWLPVEMGVAG